MPRTSRLFRKESGIHPGHECMHVCMHASTTFVIIIITSFVVLMSIISEIGISCIALLACLHTRDVRCIPYQQACRLRRLAYFLCHLKMCYLIKMPG